MNKVFIIFIYTMLIVYVSKGVCEESEDSSEDISFLVIPVATYSSDTGFGGGFGALKSYHSTDNQVSTLQFLALYTEKKQFQTLIKLVHYFRNTDDRMIIKFGYIKYPTNFYGMGNNTSNKNPEKYTPEYFEGRVLYEKKIFQHFKIKTIFLFRNQSLIKSEPDGVFKLPNVPWSSGRFDAGPGIGLLWDSRDNSYATKRGMFAKIEYRGILIQNEGGAFNFLSMEVRKFLNPLSDLVLAYMFRLEDCRGDTPFYLLADIGGMDRLRGYEYRRFLEKKAILFQHDIRFPIWGPVGGAAFIASGRVSDKVQDLFSGTYHTGYGGGLRYIFNEEDNLVLRFDYALGKDSKGVYFTFSEAF
ncbi:MAG TPA: hypothetical protein ENH82_11655 [bacterium]|nr:hypothetical protein [bacterium]